MLRHARVMQEAGMQNASVLITGAGGALGGDGILVNCVLPG